MTAPKVAIGVDGYAGGWVAVALIQAAALKQAAARKQAAALSQDGGLFVRAWAAPTLAELLAGTDGRSPVGVDIPLGGVAHGRRTADLEAQVLLGRRRSTLFTVPPRPLWEYAEYADANAELKRRTGGGLSKQTFNLFRKMLEAERVRDERDLFEVHPELVFAGLAEQRGDGWVPLPPKTTWAGLTGRRSLLAGVGVVLPDDLGPAGRVPPDDVLDAAAVAWCAYQVGRGGARHVPDPPEQFDERGRPILIWY